MSIDLRKFHEGFFDEVAEHIATIEAFLIGFESDGRPDRETLDSIFRAAHSIKGGSATFGLTAMAEFTHDLESLLDGFRSGTLAATGSMIDVLFRAIDVLKQQVAAYRAGRELGGDVVALVASQLRACAAEANAPVAPSAREYGLTLRSEKASAQHEAVVAAMRSVGTLSGVAFDETVWTATLTTERDHDEVRELFEFVCRPGDTVSVEPVVAQEGLFGFFDDDEPETVAAPLVFEEFAPQAPTAATIRVSLQKVDHLMNLVGELVIAQSRLTDAAGTLQGTAFERVHASIEEIARHARDLREGVMSIRMLPIGTVFGRFPRVVRELSLQLGKAVRLVTAGDDTELDKSLIEALVDPLTHLVRNSLDHGIESSDERSAAGKPETGTLLLRASHESANVVLSLEDDGRGLDRKRILAKARSSGIAVDDAMSDAEVWQLIFLPGFSTAREVTDLSGRGVGMDVVRRNIAGLGGSIELFSQPGGGTRVTIRLPLTLAIVDGLSVRVADATYVLPLTAIVESFQPAPGDVRSVAPESDVVFFRGEALPVVTLHRVFRCAERMPRYEDGILIVVEAEGRRAALFVDALEGQHQVVVKSLEANFRRVDGLAGATVMGNGHIAFIVDVPSLIPRTPAHAETAHAR